MNKNQIWQLKERLKQGEALMIYANNQIKHFYKDKDGNSHKQYIGDLEDFPETIVPLKNKPFLTPRLKGKKRNIKFGTILPKYHKKDKNSEKIKLWTMIFNTAKSMGCFEIKNSVETGDLRLRYNVETIHGISVYYYESTPRYIEFNGERLVIEQLKPELNTEYFTNEELGLEDK